MDQNYGLEAKTSKKEIRIKILMNLQEVFSKFIKISLQGQNSQIGITIRTLKII